MEPRLSARRTIRKIAHPLSASRTRGLHVWIFGAIQHLRGPLVGKRR